MTFLTDTAIPHLRTQLERARAVLLTGAGFSRAAKNLENANLPTGEELAQILWSVAFPTEPFDPNSSLKDIFAAARSHASANLRTQLTRCLSVDPSSIEPWMAAYYGQPWHRIYTLNVDNLATAVEQRHPLPRGLLQTSATTSTEPKQVAASSHLEVIHLNGMLEDGPENITFSEDQYARRLASPDHLYLQLAAELLSRPVVFVGTSLDESLLWQSIEQRRLKGQRGARELRPRSYLVCPNLGRAREARLAEFNVHWLQMTAQEFAEQILEDLRCAAQTGFKFLGSGTTPKHQSPRLQDVAEHATSPGMPSEFLLGDQPIWADVQSGRAIERECDTTLREAFERRLTAGDPPGLLVITGTAGSGKTTSLMRLALRASAQGHSVGWVDTNTDFSARAVVSAMRREGAPRILAVDAGETFGRRLSLMLREVALIDSQPLVVVSVRAGTVDNVVNPTVLRDVPREEFTVPPLADADIDALLDVLDRENRLGALKGKSRQQQRDVFRRYAGRQLLVAMISATSGKPLEDKIREEYDDLDYHSRLVYATVSLATTFGYSLHRQEILVALDDSSNDQLNRIQKLLDRHILVEHPRGSGLIQTRHKMIADRLRGMLQQRLQLGDIVDGLGLLAATLPIDYRNRRRALRLLTGVTNHDFLHQVVGLDRSKSFYQKLEALLSRDFHYWLQRGSLEVEFGDLHLAENFLGQARGLAPKNNLVENEWAYLQFRKANASPLSEGARGLVIEATDILHGLIKDDRTTPHPFHVLGSQGLAWSRRAALSGSERERYVRGLRSEVDEGVRRFPREQDLRTLAADLKREYLQIAVAPGR